MKLEKIKAIVVDDELRARTLLQGMLHEYLPQVEVLALCEDVPSAVKTIRKLKPNLIFLDIEMPGNSGLELFDFFNEGEIDFEIIFTTAYSDYAIQAFKLSAVDYLLKPIDVAELENAVARYQTKTNRQKSELAILSQNLKRKNTGKIAVPTSAGVKLIDETTIVYLKADSSYTEIKLNDKSQIIVSRTLKNFEETLATDSTFFRCHKSYVVNMRFVKEYIKSDGGYLVLDTNETLPLSPEKADEFLERVMVVKR